MVTKENIRLVCFVSDGTGITTESLGTMMLNQFSTVKFKRRTFPFIDTVEKANTLIQQIKEESGQYSERPIIFSSIVDKDVREAMHKCEGFYVDLYDVFIKIMEDELQTSAQRLIGRTHGIDDIGRYDRRMEAVNFTLNHDDGISDRNLQKADVILVGVSRSGKTPTCLYLALHYGIRAANYPLTPDDLSSPQLPRMLRDYQHKLFGLTIDADRLHHIRSARRPDSTYAQQSTCRSEVLSAEAMFQRYRIPYMSSTHKSVEELSASIMQEAHLKRCC